jgi:hypothetical protein
MKTRCTGGAVDVTGADIVRISRTLALEPWQFTQTAPAAAGEPDGIILDKSRRRVSLTLAMAATGCVFSIWTGSGAGCCGLGDIAPTSCRIFPVDPGDNDLADNDPADNDPADSDPADTGSGSSRPEPEDRAIDHDKLAELVRGWEADRGHWREVIRRWNAMAANSHPAAPSLDIEDFQRYLLEAQAAREAATAWPEEVQA